MRVDTIVYLCVLQPEVSKQEIHRRMEIFIRGYIFHAKTLQYIVAMAIIQFNDKQTSSTLYHNDQNILNSKWRSEKKNRTHEK